MWGAGDHEQLRPKLQQQTLSVASGCGIDADMSLFERLQRQGYPMATLVLQRRMQPDISAAIRETVYPNLQVLPSELTAVLKPATSTCASLRQRCKAHPHFKWFVRLHQNYRSAISCLSSSQ